jgi:hypothetical protein
MMESIENGWSLCSYSRIQKSWQFATPNFELDALSTQLLAITVVV